MANIVTRKGEVVQDPPLAKFLFNDPRASVVWLVLRVWLGYTWIMSGLPKWSNPKWLSGESLQGYWTNAVKIPETGKPPISFDWYRSFIQFMLDTESYKWFAQLVMVGEVLVGVALILGLFTGIAAFFGGLMNWNFMMAGSASTNPMLFVVAVVLILAWKVAGYLGADYFLLKWIGTPWHEAGEQASSRQQVPSPVAGD